MKAVVFAYHDMGCTGVQALLDAGYEIAAIFTHPDNAQENHFFGSVARLAAEQGIAVYAPDDVNHPLWIDRIRAMAPEVIFSFYYRHLLSDAILSLAPAVPGLMAEGATFIASGIIDSRKDEVIAGLEKAGLSVVEVKEKRGWECIICKKA